MAIELRTDITSLGDGYKADIMGMLVGETESGVIEWKPKIGPIGSTWYEAKLSELLTAEITPLDFHMGAKRVKLTQKVNDASDIKLIIDNSSPFFESRITELEKAIFDKLYKQEFTDVFKNVREKREQRKQPLKPLKLYPNDHKGENIPALKPLKKPVPHMKDREAEFKRDIAAGIAKVAKRIGKRKHCKITIDKIVIEVWSDPVTK